MQTTVNVPQDLVDVFRAELADTVAQAADLYAEAAQGDRDDAAARLTQLQQAAELNHLAPLKGGPVTGESLPLALTARGVLIQLVDDLTEAVNRFDLDADRVKHLAELIGSWVIEADRIDREGAA